MRPYHSGWLWGLSLYIKGEKDILYIGTGSPIVLGFIFSGILFGFSFHVHGVEMTSGRDRSQPSTAFPRNHPIALSDIFIEVL